MQLQQLQTFAALADMNAVATQQAMGNIEQRLAQAQAQAQGHGRSASDACVPTFTSLGFTNEQQHQNGPHSSIPIPIPASSVPNNGSNVSPT